ncbi:MAG: non-canonical purine NTP pyrophosphatase, partial [Anaeromyxobacteraceae bacterium]
NNDLLLERLADRSDDERRAEYRAALVLAAPAGGVLAVVRGVCRGRIGLTRRGTGGFGYDPLFIPDAQPPSPPGGVAGVPLSMAELPPEAKDAISHRGAAFRSLIPYVARLAALDEPRARE